MNNKFVVIITIFVLGLMFCFTYKSEDLVEGFDMSMSQCPNMLVKKGNKIHLINSKKAMIPGVNPIIFKNSVSIQNNIWTVRCP